MRPGTAGEGAADPVTGGEPLAERALALMASGWANPERLAAAVAGHLGGGDLLGSTAEPSDVAASLLTAARRAGAAADDDRVATVRERLAAHGAVLRVAGEPGYPGALLDAWPELGAPLWLAIRGEGGRLPEGPAVAVVGTRRPTLDGERTAAALGRLLARHGVTVVSGMARGIDQAAHQGALDAGGSTVAVLGAGLDVDYPRGDGALRAAIAASGGLVTELAPDARPLPRHFIARNRIVSGLAAATVVVEGRARSGALATARLAAAQGRDVWAVPGSLRSPASQGPLALIRDGAQVLTRLEDVLASVPAVRGIAGGAGPSERPTPPGLSAEAAAVLPLLGAVPAGPGALATAARLPLPTVLAAVGELSGRGLAVATARGLVAGPG